MDEELPYKILKIMRDIYNKDPTGYMDMNYFEPALKLPEEVIQGALIYLKEKDWIKSFKDAHGEWVQRINAKGMDELLNHEKIHADDDEPLEFDVSHEDHSGKIKVFISHKFVKSDQKLAQTLEDYLEQHNIYGYLAERKKEYDIVFGEKIKKEIESSDYVVAIITKNSHFAPSVHQEIGYAMGKEVPIRIMAEEHEAKGVLVEGKDIEIFSRQNFEKSLVNIIKDIQKNGIQTKSDDRHKRLSQKPVFAFSLTFGGDRLNLNCKNIGNGLAKNIKLIVKSKGESSLQSELKVNRSGLGVGDYFTMNNWQKHGWVGIGYYNFDCEVSGSCQDIFGDNHLINEKLHFEGEG